MAEHRKPNTEKRVFLLLRVLRALWSYLRESAGENDYEHYRMRALARGESPVEAAKFYISRLEHKYSRPNRCC